MKRYIFRLCALSSLLIVACSSSPGAEEREVDGGIASADLVACDPAGDEDRDGISNGDEGCLEGRDTDGDGLPDWEDLDSDDDRIRDDIELGVEGACLGPRPERWPCDSDGDGTPDYLDTDSDNDGLADGLEDVNGDGLLGCCITTCGAPGPAQRYLAQWWRTCPLNESGCGSGQRCEAGLCRPPRTLECSDGETDPRLLDTFSQGTSDFSWGSFVCRDATEADPRGAKVVMRRSERIDRYRGISVMLERSARWTPFDLDSDGKLRGAMVDHLEAGEDVAAFLIMHPGRHATLREEVDDVLDDLFVRAPVLGLGQITEVSPGARVPTADFYEQRRGIELELSGGTVDLGVVRHGLASALLGDPPLGETASATPVGVTAARAVLRLSVIRTYARQGSSGPPSFPRDDQGIALERADSPSSRWVVVVAALADAAAVREATRRTGVIVDDLVSGNAVVGASAKNWALQCEVFDLASSGGNPLSLRFPAAAASLTVAVDGVEVARSRERGFDYDVVNNAIVLDQGTSGHMVVSYRHWVPVIEI